MNKIYGWSIIVLSIVSSFLVSQNLSTLLNIHSVNDATIIDILIMTLVPMLIFLILFFVGVFLIFVYQKQKLNILTQEANVHISKKLTALLFFIIMSLYNSFSVLLTFSYMYDNYEKGETVIFAIALATCTYFILASIFSVITLFIDINRKHYVNILKSLLISPVLVLIYIGISSLI